MINKDEQEKQVENYLKKKRDKEIFIDALKNFFQIISYFIGVICCVLIFIHKIRNPHLTETEVMLYSFSKYWWVALLVIISTLINNK